MFEFSVPTGDIYMALWPSGVRMLKRDAITVFSVLLRYEFISPLWLLCGCGLSLLNLDFINVGRIKGGP